MREREGGEPSEWHLLFPPPCFFFLQKGGMREGNQMEILRKALEVWIVDCGFGYEKRLSSREIDIGGFSGERVDEGKLSLDVSRG